MPKLRNVTIDKVPISYVIYIYIYIFVNPSKLVFDTSYVKYADDTIKM